MVKPEMPHFSNFRIASLLFFALFSLQAQAQDTLMVDAGGFEMRMVKRGSGAPTVIMDNGFGMQLEWWFGLDDALAAKATVVTFDRAFLGQSGRGNTDRSGAVVAAELKQALESAGIAPPYILVGFSLGGYYAQAFARANPDETSGLLLIDPLAPPAFYMDFKTEFPDVAQWELGMLDFPADDPVFHEAALAHRDTHDTGLPAHIPATVLIANQAPGLPTEDMPDIPDLEQKFRLIQDLWVHHQLEFASRHPKVTAQIIEDSSNYIHRHQMDAVLNAFEELTQRIELQSSTLDDQRRGLTREIE